MIFWTIGGCRLFFSLALPWNLLMSIESLDDDEKEENDEGREEGLGGGFFLGQRKQQKGDVVERVERELGGLISTGSPSCAL